MTTVRVNLLPRELALRERARKITAGTVVAVVVFALLLAGLYALKLAEVGDAEEQRETVRADVARLQAQVAQLQEYQALAAELDARNALLADAMDTEISYARVFNDLSLAFPASASLRTLQAARVEPEVVTAAAAAPGGAVARLSFNGYSVERFAPGVETVLVEFDKVPVFFNSYLTNAALEEIESTEVTGFNGSVQLDDAAYTNRYADGLPEGEAP